MLMEFVVDDDDDDLCADQDMVAFSQCVYEGDEAEKTRLDNAREKSWRGKFNRTGRVNLSPEDIRRDGKCPLTPVEVHTTYINRNHAFRVVCFPRTVH